MRTYLVKMTVLCSYASGSMRAHSVKHLQERDRFFPGAFHTQQALTCSCMDSISNLPKCAEEGTTCELAPLGDFVIQVLMIAHRDLAFRRGQMLRWLWR